MRKTKEITKLRVFCAALFGILALFGGIVWGLLILKCINFLFLLFGHDPYNGILHFLVIPIIIIPFLMIYLIISYGILSWIIGKDLLDIMV